MICVIGSGPAGVACASALLAGGANVTILDAGLELEPERGRRVAALRAVAFESWDKDSLRVLREGVQVTRGGIPLKLAYGSAFPYRDPLDQPVAGDGVEVKPSFARGGLSNVWGASVLPYRTEDMSRWPVTAEDLSPHYRAVLGMMPFSGRHDRLEKQFPLHHDQPGMLASSSQATAFLEDLELNARALEAHGVTFGVARLAIQADQAGKPGCVYCGKCLYGCPYGFIYNSTQTLELLRTHPAFTYHPGVVVQRVGEIGSDVEVTGRTLSGEPFRMRADRVFVACGVLSTARVVLTSLEAFEQPLHAADNCYFLLPLMRYRSRPRATDEPLHTLAQAFIEVVDDAIGPQTAHLQVYTYNELFRDEVARLLGPLDRVMPAALRRSMLGRLLLVQGYLHSDLSARIRITLRRESPDRPAGLTLAAERNPLTLPALSALKRKLWSERGSMKAFSLSPALRAGEPGRGFHTGGTFPMRSKPAAFESDVLGRPTGFSRVHVVDASVFPSLPATTITLSVMANAHRIGSSALA